MKISIQTPEVISGVDIPTILFTRDDTCCTWLELFRKYNLELHKYMQKWQGSYYMRLSYNEDKYSPFWMLNEPIIDYLKVMKVTEPWALFVFNIVLAKRPAHMVDMSAHDLEKDPEVNAQSPLEYLPPPPIPGTSAGDSNAVENNQTVKSLKTLAGSSIDIKREKNLVTTSLKGKGLTPKKVGPVTAPTEVRPRPPAINIPSSNGESQSTRYRSPPSPTIALTPQFVIRAKRPDVIVDVKLQNEQYELSFYSRLPAEPIPGPSRTNGPTEKEPGENFKKLPVLEKVDGKIKLSTPILNKVEPLPKYPSSPSLLSTGTGQKTGRFRSPEVSSSSRENTDQESLDIAPPLTVAARNRRICESGQDVPDRLLKLQFMQTFMLYEPSKFSEMKNELKQLVDPQDQHNFASATQMMPTSLKALLRAFGLRDSPTVFPVKID